MPPPGEVPGANPIPAPEQPAPTVETVQRAKLDLTSLRARLVAPPTTPRTTEQQREIDTLVAEAATTIGGLGAIDKPETFNQAQAVALMQKSTLLLQQMTAKMRPPEASAFVGTLNKFMAEFKKVGDQVAGFGVEQLESFADMFKMLGMNGFVEIIRKIAAMPAARIKTIQDKTTALGLTLALDANDAVNKNAATALATQHNNVRVQMRRKATALNGTLNKQTEGAALAAQADAYGFGLHMDAIISKRAAADPVTLPKFQEYGATVLSQATTAATTAEAARTANPVPVVIPPPAGATPPPRPAGNPT